MKYFRADYPRELRIIVENEADERVFIFLAKAMKTYGHFPDSGDGESPEIYRQAFELACQLAMLAHGDGVLDI